MADEEMQNTLSVGNSTYYATEYSPSHHTGSHLAGCCMVYVNSWRLMYMGRHRLAEEFIRVIVAIVVSPAPVHIVRPTTVVMVLDSSLPTRHITTTINSRRLAPYQTSATGHKMIILSFLDFGGMCHAIRTRVIAGTAMNSTAIRFLSIFTTLHAILGTFASPWLGACTITCHRHCHHQSRNHHKLFHSLSFVLSYTFLSCHIAKIRHFSKTFNGFLIKRRGTFSIHLGDFTELITDILCHYAHFCVSLHTISYTLLYNI